MRLCFRADSANSMMRTNRDGGTDLPTRAATAMDPSRTDSSARCARPGFPSAVRSRAQKIQTLLLLAVGFAILVWGSCWKLSVYSPHPDATFRTLAPRLWDGPLPSISLRSAHFHAKSPLKASLSSLHESFSLRPVPLSEAFVATSENVPDVNKFIPSVTSRPPPFDSSSHS